MKFETMFRLVSSAIALVFVLILCWWGFMGYIAYTTSKTISTQDFSSGLKPVIERLWCGNPGCLNK